MMVHAAFFIQETTYVQLWTTCSVIFLVFIEFLLAFLKTELALIFLFVVVYLTLV